jgi:hypothetical protein
MVRYLGRKAKRKQAKRLHRGIRKGLDGKHRVWTLMSAFHLGLVEDIDQRSEHIKDYPVSTTIGCYDSPAEAQRALSKPRLEGEWK